VRLVTVQDHTYGSIVAVEDSGERRLITDTDGFPYRDVEDLLRRAADWREAANRASDPISSDRPLLRPVLNPGAVVCVGLNYRKHIMEMGRELPTAPTLFAKFARSLTDPEETIVLPDASEKVDYEGELTVVIGTGGRKIPKDKAWDAVAGLTLLNDVSMRDWQRRSLQFLAGKTWERSTPVGPAVVTADVFPDFGNCEIVTRVNGEERQRAPMSDLIFDIPTLIADLSQVMTLQPGDLIATGTPSGVGAGMKPPCFLQPGDVVEIAMEPIGVLRNRFERTT
jgi:acylpyruvate hydrolase